MNSKALAVFVAFLVYAFFTGRYILCDIKQVCNSQESIQTSEVEFNDFVAYAYEGYDAIPGEKFDQMKLEIVNQLSEANKIHVTGLYSPSETNMSGVEDLGLARAMSFRKLFPEVEDSQFSISSKEVPIDDSQKFIEGVIWEVQIENQYVSESANVVVLHFDEEVNDVIDNYLNTFAQKYASEDVYIDVIGHSANDGDPGNNFTLALNRANVIQSLLVSKGFNPDRVNVSSKGETEPIADNSTEAGRVKNKRVELLIN